MIARLLRMVCCANPSEGVARQRMQVTHVGETARCFLHLSFPMASDVAVSRE
ncbi:hypothetical protein VFPFJ_05343 [Purpureocillium lilacinum]|uniref:Uncharacterized protein n=1 Tax=Purpureocillium lilacinum TaxID=33203 RepID=A0A179H2B2_PURLI|nr:hypothetical protein VFPFJ_05343 [Purpureocillium lilacinum]OAQ84396.1 hypothetical protein VFPBJ_03164 [Purpureocillium lilacinum]OAQ91184.1 hypothetical protein VFPFJ_05343 [Purpureocillium lilacinum]